MRTLSRSLGNRITFLGVLLLLICREAVAQPAVALSPAEMLAADFKELMARQPVGTRHESTMMPLRDGVLLATDIFLPPSGKGPWPVMLLRTPYSRFRQRPNAEELAAHPFVMVCQNQRGRHGSEGQPPKDTFANEQDDSYDAIEWCAKQPWCNGQVVMWGSSGHGISPSNAVWSHAPHLTAVYVNLTGDDAYLHWCFSNGARRAMYSWMHARNQVVGVWPRPTTILYDLAARQEFLAERSRHIPTYYLARAGWFDLFSEAALDSFAALAPQGRAFVVMAPSGHASIGDTIFPHRDSPPIATMPTIKQILAGDEPPRRSQLVYYLMGDTKDTTAPGNMWLTTDSWPVAHTPIDFFLTETGSLTTSRPTASDASLSYRYDPRDPAPSFGGNGLTTEFVGPRDQRSLRERPDMLRFVTEPLAEPLGSTGKVWLKLDFTSDAPDTMFVAKLVDIYPDGYEALIRESAGLARYHRGLNQPAPIDPGKHYTLRLDLWSTALVFNHGHRIGLYVTSSSRGAYEVHPNSYEPVTSIDGFRTARNTIHLSAAHASRLILPVIAPEIYRKP